MPDDIGQVDAANLPEPVTEVPVPGPGRDKTEGHEDVGADEQTSGPPPTTRSRYYPVFDFSHGPSG
jgi:hypothetical protein